MSIVNRPIARFFNDQEKLKISPIVITYIILGAALLLILSELVRPDLVAILTAVALGLTGVLTPQETFSGFSRSAVITILAIFILAEGLQKTGITDLVGNALLKLSGGRESWIIAIVTFAAAFLSLFMNNIAAALVLLPAASGVTRKTGVSPAHLMIPLAFGAILGGMATLFTSANIVVSSLLRDQGIEGFGVLDFLPLGIPIVLAGGIYLVVWGRRLLPATPSVSQVEATPLSETSLTDIYQLKDRLIWVRIPAGSPIANQPLAQSHLRDSYRLNVIAIKRHQQMNSAPTPNTILAAGDLLWITAHPDDLKQSRLSGVVEFFSDSNQPASQLEEQEFALVEAVLTHRSHLIGKNLGESHFREKYGKGSSCKKLKSLYPIA